MVLSLGGVRLADRQAACDTLTQTEGVRDAYFAMVLADSAMPYGESLGITAERFWGKETTQVRTEEGNYIVTVGEYQSESEAQSALVNAELGETGLTIASSLPDDRPHDAE